MAFEFRLLPFLAIVLTCFISSKGNFHTAVRLVTIHPHNTSAFTEGLVFDDGALIESTGLNGKSFIRKYKLSDLNTDFLKTNSTRSMPFIQEFGFNSSHFGEGVTVLGDNVFALTYKAQQLIMLSRQDFQLIGMFPFMTSTREGWGLTTDGEFLIASDGSANILFFDPKDDFMLHHNITVRNDGHAVTDVNELEYVEGELLANVWHENCILRIDIVTGNVIEQIDLNWIPYMVSNIHSNTMKRSKYKQEAVMNGIAYNPATRHIFLTGKLWDSIFELELSILNSRDHGIVP